MNFGHNVSMKKVLLTLVLIFFVSGSAFAESVYINGGHAYIKSGSTYYGSDNSRYTQVGNTVYGSDGSKIVKYGDHVYISTLPSMTQNNYSSNNNSSFYMPPIPKFTSSSERMSEIKQGLNLKYSTLR